MLEGLMSVEDELGQRTLALEIDTSVDDFSAM
jgi:hypothetical protein